MGSVFVNGVERVRAGQSGGRDVGELIAGVFGLEGAPARRIYPDREPVHQRREFTRTPGAGLAVLCVGDDVPSNYYKVHHATCGRTIVYLFSDGHENDALELARREGVKSGVLSVLRPTPLSSRSGVGAVLALVAAGEFR